VIVGIGIDRVVIARITRSHQRFGERFIRHCFTTDEYALACAKQPVERRLAMFFAAKEAVSKALGTGFVGVSPSHIEVYYHPSGQPAIRLHSTAQQAADTRAITSIHLSLTDDDGIAMAFAVAEG